MNLPEEYEWLNNIGTLPRTIELGLNELGTQEIAGSNDNEEILSWADELNAAGVRIKGYVNDEIPWCGLFVAMIVYLRKEDPSEVVKDPLWARNWSKYGLRSSVAILGDVLVFVRNGGGHVGFYVAEDNECYHVLGGNQGNKVSITRIKKSRCVDIRRPIYKNLPKSAKSYRVDSSGTVSKNEV